ncbi:MAG: type I restriction-modification enzyme R subunit C-terminal domain-containing protein, partial [Pirellulales bacterium]
PDDYLESFRQYVEQNIDQVEALQIVCQRPRDITRQQLRELKLELDRHHFNETGLRTAVRETTNRDIAASIIGHIRHAVLGAPLELSGGPQLFIDNYMINSLSGLSRTINTPDRLPNPIVDDVIDRNRVPYLSVLYDSQTQQYRLWYNNYDGGLGYMTSTDGINWIRPHQNLPDPGGPLAPFYSAAVIDDGVDYADPSERYKFIFWYYPQGEYPAGVYIATSPNGLAWDLISPGPVINADHDVVDLFYDPIREQYIASTSQWSTTVPNTREPTQTVSTDLINWETPYRTIFPDPRDEGITQFYGISAITKRGDLVVGLLKVLRDDVNAEGAPAGAYGTGYTVLTWSRDGVTWQRDTEPFINRSPTPGEWDHAMAWGDSQLIVGDKTYLYYGGYKWGHKSGERVIGLATIGMDRYVAREAGSTPGTLVTPVFVTQEDGVTVNAKVDGMLRIRVLDEYGAPLPGFDWSDFTTISGDSIDFMAQWTGDFSTLDGVPIALEFNMSDTQLYGFTLVPSPFSESNWLGGSGNWSENANWSTSVFPDVDTTAAVFGNAIAATETVFTNAAVTVKDVTFDNLNSYVIAGGGSVNLNSGTGVSTVSVLQGSHQFQTVVNLTNNTTVDVASGASLAFNNVLNLGGFTLTTTGGGTLNINNQLNGGGGSVVMAAGVLGGSGTISGNLTNSGATVAPGNSPGKLTVTGNYSQTAGSLEIEIDGTNDDDVSSNRQYDLLSVGGSLTISGGSLDVVMGFTASPGDTFNILDATSIDLTGATLNLGTPGTDMAWDESQLTVDGSLIALSAKLGDMDADLAITTADVAAACGRALASFL